MGLLQWAAVMLCWLLGMAVQYQQSQLANGHAHALIAVVCAVACAVVCALLAGSAAKWQRWCRTALVCTAAALLGWAFVQWQATTRWHMGWPSHWNKQTVVLTGRVDSLPNAQPWGQQFEVAVSSVTMGAQTWLAHQPWGMAPGTCPDRVRLTWGQAPPGLKPGQTWRWSVQLQAPNGLVNPGGFDAQRWAFVNGLRAQGKVMDKPSRGREARPAALLSSPTWGSAGQIDRWRLQISQRIFKQVPDQGMAGLLVGLTVGQQSAISTAHWQILRNTGIAHLASISGVHITMMGWLLGVCMGALWRRSVRCMQWATAVTASRFATLAGATAYAMLAGWGVPAQRTVWMLALVMVLQHSGRRWPFPLVLLLAAAGVTLLDPWALVEASFWLSFAAVGLLMLAGDAEPKLQAVGWWPRLRHALKDLWRTQWVATLGLAPLSLVFFQTMSLLSFATNMVCIPWFTLFITPLALLGVVWPFALDMAASGLQATMAVLAPLSASPAALWQGQEVEAWAAVLAMLGMAWCLMPLPWRWRLAAWPALLPLLWPNSLSQAWPAPPMEHVQIMAAEVGQGTSVLVRTAKHALLFDTGPRLSESSDTGLRVLVGLLRAMGVQRLDTLMISHADMDHVGGAASVLANVPVAVLHSSLPKGHALLDVPGVGGPAKPLTCLAGQRWVWDGVEFEVLHPDHDVSEAERAAEGDNATSCVLRVNAKGRRVLLTGDIETPQEAQLVAADASALRSEVLLVPHHGSHTSSTPAFLAAVAPSVAVIQAGERNRYGHPHKDVVARYRALDIPLVQSTTCGAWLWQSTVPSPMGQCLRGQHKHYWHSQAQQATQHPSALPPVTVE